MSENSSAVPVEIVTEKVTLSFDELCGQCRLESESVIEMVEVGILDPVGEHPGDWRFSSKALYRIQATLRLRRELELNLPGAALVLDLLEESRAMRAELESLKRQLLGPP